MVPLLPLFAFRQLVFVTIILPAQESLPRHSTSETEHPLPAPALPLPQANGGSPLNFLALSKLKDVVGLGGPERWAGALGF